MRRSPTRRRILRSAPLAGLAATAGCLSRDGIGQVVGGSGDGSGSDSPAHTPPASLDDWLADANGYDGEVKRFGPQSRPEILVGHPVDGGMAFDPPVIEVAPPAIVRWNWTGHGGQHNVVALDGTFDSGRTNAQAGTSYRHAFETPGEYPFVSEPHREEGMKGAVIVKEPPSTGNPTVDAWVADSSNFDGSVADRMDADTVTVAVGAAGNGGEFAFDPTVLRIAAGTTVEWKWTGAGGPHNVVFQDADGGSGEVVADPGVHFERTFESPGTYRYACQPHRSLGMKGAVIVE